MCSADRSHLYAQIDKDEIFWWIPERLRVRLKENLTTWPGAILSLHTFQEDTKWLEPACNVIKANLLPNEHTKATLRQHLSRSFKISRTFIPRDAAFARAYRTVWLSAMGLWAELGTLQPRQEDRAAILTLRPTVECHTQLMSTAKQQGFRTSAVEKFEQGTFHLAEAAFQHVRPGEYFTVSSGNRSSVIGQIQQLLERTAPVPTPAKASLSTTCDYVKFDLRQRCGRMFQAAYRMNASCLSYDNVYHAMTDSGESMSDFGVARDTFRRFFGTEEGSRLELHNNELPVIHNHQISSARRNDRANQQGRIPGTGSDGSGAMPQAEARLATRNRQMEKNGSTVKKSELRRKRQSKKPVVTAKSPYRIRNGGDVLIHEAASQVAGSHNQQGAQDSSGARLYSGLNGGDNLGQHIVSLAARTEPELGGGQDGTIAQHDIHTDPNIDVADGPVRHYETDLASVCSDVFRRRKEFSRCFIRNLEGGITVAFDGLVPDYFRAAVQNKLSVWEVSEGEEQFDLQMATLESQHPVLLSGYYTTSIAKLKLVVEEIPATDQSINTAQVPEDLDMYGPAPGTGIQESTAQVPKDMDMYGPAPGTGIQEGATQVAADGGPQDDDVRMMDAKLIPDTETIAGDIRTTTYTYRTVEDSERLLELICSSTFQYRPKFERCFIEVFPGPLKKTPSNPTTKSYISVTYEGQCPGPPVPLGTIDQSCASECYKKFFGTASTTDKRKDKRRIWEVVEEAEVFMLRPTPFGTQHPVLLSDFREKNSIVKLRSRPAGQVASKRDLDEVDFLKRRAYLVRYQDFLLCLAYLSRSHTGKWRAYLVSQKHLSGPGECATEVAVSQGQEGCVAWLKRHVHRTLYEAYFHPTEQVIRFQPCHAAQVQAGKGVFFASETDEDFRNEIALNNTDVQAAEKYLRDPEKPKVVYFASTGNPDRDPFTNDDAPFMKALKCAEQYLSISRDVQYTGLQANIRLINALLHDSLEQVENGSSTSAVTERLLRLGVNNSYPDVLEYRRTKRRTKMQKSGGEGEVTQLAEESPVQEATQAGTETYEERQQEQSKQGNVITGEGSSPRGQRPRANAGTRSSADVTAKQQATEQLQAEVDAPSSSNVLRASENHVGQLAAEHATERVAASPGAEPAAGPESGSTGGAGLIAGQQSAVDGSDQIEGSEVGGSDAPQNHGRRIASAIQEQGAQVPQALPAQKIPKAAEKPKATETTEAPNLTLGLAMAEVYRQMHDWAELASDDEDYGRSESADVDYQRTEDSPSRAPKEKERVPLSAEKAAGATARAKGEAAASSHASSGSLTDNVDEHGLIRDL